MCNIVLYCILVYIIPPNSANDLHVSISRLRGYNSSDGRSTFFYRYINISLSHEPRLRLYWT